MRALASVRGKPSRVPPSRWESRTGLAAGSTRRTQWTHTAYATVSTHSPRKHVLIVVVVAHPKGAAARDMGDRT